ncbi:MAG: hypothetical protein QOH58_3032 [Thermoleophilaceae bacterium]|jgi:hypothetical protein|nr:hypothetical protein [Thermoleophilaceae bacterium]
MAIERNIRIPATASDKDVTVIGSIEMRGPRLRKVGAKLRKEAAKDAEQRRVEREQPA